MSWRESLWYTEGCLSPCSGRSIQRRERTSLCCCARWLVVFATQLEIIVILFSYPRKLASWLLWLVGYCLYITSDLPLIPLTMFNDGSPKSKKSPPGAKTTSSSWSFDIDNYLNRFVPRPRLYLLPGPISRLLGHRTTPQPPIPEPLVWLWAFVGTFLGISLVTAIFHAPAIRSHFPTNAPLIIVGSLGATGTKFGCWNFHHQGLYAAAA